MKRFVVVSDLKIGGEWEFVLSMKAESCFSRTRWRTVFTGIKVSLAVGIFPCISGLFLLKFWLTSLKWFSELQRWNSGSAGDRIFRWLLHFFPSSKNKFWLFVTVKNKLTSAFYASELLLEVNFVITLSKFVVDPLACSLWIPNTFTMLWGNLSSIRGA